MKKGVGVSAVIAVLILVSYATLSVSRSHSSPPAPSLSETYFNEVLDDLPWVRYGKRNQSERELFYYQQVKYLYATNSQLGFTLLNTVWIQDYLSEDEAYALDLLADLSHTDPEIALRCSQTFWFQNGISTQETAIMQDVLTIANRDLEMAGEMTSAYWFFLAGGPKVHDGIRILMDIPPDLTHAVIQAPWFSSDPSLSELRAVAQLTRLYGEDKNVALEIVEVYEPQYFGALEQVTNLYTQDRALADLFFSSRVVTEENFLSLSHLSQIAQQDRPLALSLVLNASLDSHVLSSLAGIYARDPALGEVVVEEIGMGRIPLRYIEMVTEVGEVDPGLMKATSLFVTTNPEFVYEDRTEPYRYHVLTQIIDTFPIDTVQEYKNLVFVTCAVYGNRFYVWQDSDEGVLSGWSADRKLNGLEKEAITNLLTYLIEQNRKDALVTDLRIEGYDYLYGVVDIPFTHLVNYDGTMIEAAQSERGTSFVFAIVYNINTLENRYTRIQEEISHVGAEYPYSTPLTDLILKEGEKRDRLFLYFCAKNWEHGACADQTLQTRMDSIAMGISSTAMYWDAPGRAHMYPAYIPSRTVAEQVQSNPHSYGNPFVYKGFIAPYDSAGSRDTLGSDIDTVKIYDVEVERKVGLFDSLQEGFFHDKKVAAIFVVLAIILAVVVVETYKIVT